MSTEREKIIANLRNVKHLGVNMVGEPRRYPVTDSLQQSEIEAIADYIIVEQTKARLDERRRVTYEHESFSKELFKGRVVDVKAWYLETIADAHTRRIGELSKSLKTEGDNEH